MKSSRNLVTATIHQTRIWRFLTVLVLLSCEQPRPPLADATRSCDLIIFDNLGDQNRPFYFLGLQVEGCVTAEHSMERLRTFAEADDVLSLMSIPAGDFDSVLACVRRHGELRTIADLSALPAFASGWGPHNVIYAETDRTSATTLGPLASCSLFAELRGMPLPVELRWELAIRRRMAMCPGTREHSDGEQQGRPWLRDLDVRRHRGNEQ